MDKSPKMAPVGEVEKEVRFFLNHNRVTSAKQDSPQENLRRGRRREQGEDGGTNYQEKVVGSYTKYMSLDI